MNRFFSSMLKLAAVCALSVSILSQAYALEVRGQIAYNYEGGIFSDSPTDDDKSEALRQAKMMALKRYFSSLGPAQQRLLRKLQPQIEENPDAYLTGYTIVAQDVDKSMKVLNLVIRAEINQQMINSELKIDTASNQTATGEGSAFSALFVARRITSSKVYDAKQTQIGRQSAQQSFSADASSESVSKTTVSQSGGNTVYKASKNTYGKLASTEFDATFNDVLTSNGFETIDYADVASECGGPAVSSLQNAFMKSDSLPQSLRNKAIRAAKKCGIKYFAAGYMKVTAPQPDPVSGNRKVAVSVSGMVWDISKKLPRKVGSVGAVQAFGLGPDDDTARRVALDLAAQKAADTIASQLGIKNIY